MAEILSLGEALVEFAAVRFGPLEDAEEFRRGFGGDTSNFAVAAARLGASVAYLTRVGDDEFGRSLLRMWHREGVDTTYVRVAEGENTGIYFLSVDRQGRNGFTYYRAGSAASRLSPADVEDTVLRGARLLHTSGITQAISSSAQEAARKMMKEARGRRIAVSYDMNVRPRLMPIDRLRAIVLETLPLVDIAFLSTEDAGHVFGDLAHNAVMATVLERGVRIAVLKRDRRGCAVATADGDRFDVPALPVTAVDPTGAGDAFDAAFAVEWLAGRPLREVARFANAVGALATSGLGATSALPNRAQVEVARLSETG